MTTVFTPTAYMKNTCPFCLKFMIFLIETQLLEKFKIVSIDGNDDAEMDKYRQFLLEKTGKEAAFPTVEIAPDDYLADSDALIDYFATANNIDRNSMPGLAYYLDGMFPNYIKLFKENRALKEQLEG